MACNEREKKESECVLLTVALQADYVILQLLSSVSGWKVFEGGRCFR